MWHETDRLILHRPRLLDAGELLRILGNAEARRYTFVLENLRECRRHIAGHECQRRKRGYGPWTIVERSSGEIVGFGGLYDDPFDSGWGTEVGYHFAPAVWGRGYATELTDYCLRLAHGKLGIAEVKAFAHPDNIASQRVLLKAGFMESRFVPEMHRHLYVHRPLPQRHGPA